MGAHSWRGDTSSPETRVQSNSQKTLGLSENQPDCGDRLVLEYSTQVVPNGLPSVNTGTIVNNIMTLLVVFTQDNPLLHLTTIPKIEAKPLQAPHYRRCTRNLLTFANIAAIAYGQKLAGASIYLVECKSSRVLQASEDYEYGTATGGFKLSAPVVEENGV